MKKGFWIVLAMLAASIAMNVWFWTSEPEIKTILKRDTVWRDTTIYEPQPAETVNTGRVVYIRVPVKSGGGLTGPIGDSPRCATIVEQAGTVPMAQKDSMEVAIPIVQKRYEDSLYTAWVSGFRPNLDSIRLHQPEVETTVTKYVERPAKRLAIGPSVGVGYGIINGKPDIWAGVTVTWNFNK